MDIFFNKFFSNVPVTHAQPDKKRFCPSFLGFKNKDTFEKGKTEKTTASSAQETQKSGKSQSKGAVLKKLDNITCPYSGIKMISSEKYAEIEAELAECKNYHEMLNVIGRYQNRMQPHEKKIYHMFREYEKTHKKGSLRGCLKGLRHDSFIRLKNEECRILSDIDKTAIKFNDPELELEIRKITNKATTLITEDNSNGVFKRTKLLEGIYELTKDNENQDVVQEIWKKANKLPKSTTSVDAFVVKYASNYDEIYIAKRLLYPSTASVEHIRPFKPNPPDRSPGDSELTNFITAARDWNSARGGKPLDEFIKKHPKIPKYSQRYINDIIRAIHSNELSGYNWYPYVIKEKLYSESKGMIDLNLEKYKYSRAEAFKDAPEDVKKTYEDLVFRNSLMIKPDEEKSPIIRPDKEKKS